MSLFLLLHGGGHGGWCWEQTQPALYSLGNRSVAPDLPISDPAAGAKTYAHAAIAAVENSQGWPPDGDIVVVGHSLAGLVVPIVAAERPVRRMVFISAMIPALGKSFAEYMAGHPDLYVFDPSLRPDDDPGTGQLSWKAAREGFYQDCPADVAKRAWERLRHQEATILIEPCPLDEWPNTPSTSIVMNDDRAIAADWSRSKAREIGADVIELTGGHSPFYAQPETLAQILARL